MYRRISSPLHTLIIRRFSSRSSHTTITYVTDIEGNLGHWNRWVDLSSVVERSKSSQLLELKDGCHFVYGGDIWDRGKGDLRIIRDIVSLKKRYPSRVHIILGNRDINKIRLLSELTPEAVGKDLKTYWAGRMTSNNISDSEDRRSLVADRLRMILERTMGCPHSFEYRREELQELGVISPADSELQQGQKVADSYLDAVRPGGVLAEYLRLGSLALLLGPCRDSCLFVHGGFHAHTLGWVPSHEPGRTRKRAESVQQWVQELQDFHDREVEDLFGNSNVKRICDDDSCKENWAHLYSSEAVLRNPFTLSSEVVHGFKRGSTELGFPTANLDIKGLKMTHVSWNQQRPAVFVQSKDNLLEHVKTVGWNPTYNNSTKTIEVHFLDIDIVSTLPPTDPLPSEFYGASIDVHTLVFLRDEQKFENLDELISCIEEDISRAKGYIYLLQQFVADKKSDNNSTSLQTPKDPDRGGGGGGRGEQAYTPYEPQPWSALGGYCAPHPGSRLVQYGMGRLLGGVVNPTVIYDNFLQSGAPHLPDPVVLRYLAASGISKVFSGHQPHGDSPVVMRAAGHDGEIKFFTCDTSYSKDVKWTIEHFESSADCMQRVMAAAHHPSLKVAVDDPRDTRGQSVSEVCLYYEDPSLGCTVIDETLSKKCHSHVTMRGILSNRVKYDFDVEGYVGRSFDVIDPINTSSFTTWWVKGFVDIDMNNDMKTEGFSVHTTTRIYWACKSEDRDVFNAFISEKELMGLIDIVH